MAAASAIALPGSAALSAVGTQRNRPLKSGVNRPTAGESMFSLLSRLDATYQSGHARRDAARALPWESHVQTSKAADQAKRSHRRSPICAATSTASTTEMHALLMERGEIIDRLIAVKKTQESGSAFRPAREAEMMRRLVERHRGNLPLDTVESIWRVIISTFTYVQAPFSVHADLSAGDAAMRDSARFHFGFTVPFVPHMGAASVVEAVAASNGDLGLVPAFAIAGAGPWWTALEFDARAEDHRAAALRRARGPSGRPCRCSWSRAPPPTPWYRDARSGACACPAGRARSAARPGGDRRRDRGARPRLRRRSASGLGAARRRRGAFARRWSALGASIRASALVGSHATRYTVRQQVTTLP